MVELLETVQPTVELLRACYDLKAAGFRIALDDFVPRPGYEPLIDVADVIKVDFRLSSRQECQQIATCWASGRRQLLAEKVETAEEFNFAVDLGYSLFQGFFFSKPKLSPLPP